MSTRGPARTEDWNMTAGAKGIWQMILIGAAVIAAMTLAFWIWTPERAIVPDEVVGKWHTTDPNYADRAFEIDGTCVNFVTGEGTVSVGFIKKVRAVSEGNRTLYTISYSLDGATSEVSFFYEIIRNGEQIHFKNQENIAWTKDKSA